MPFTGEICEMLSVASNICIYINRATQEPVVNNAGQLSLKFEGASGAFYVARDHTGTIRLFGNKHAFTALHK
jgi:hypothetical protein